MRTERSSWWNATLAIVLLSLTGQGAWSPDPEYALLGRTGAMSQSYEVSASGPATSGEQALLAKISEDGVRVAAKEGNGVTAVVALLGR